MPSVAAAWSPSGSAAVVEWIWGVVDPGWWAANLELNQVRISVNFWKKDDHGVVSQNRVPQKMVGLLL